MYTMDVEYEDFDGNKVKQKCYFNLTKAEITEIQLSTKDGYDKKLKNLSASGNTGGVVTSLKELILKAYGERTDDGKFIKTPEISAAFAATDAYSEIFLKLLSDEKEQQAFFLGIMPKDVSAAVKEQLKTNPNLNLEALN